MFRVPSDTPGIRIEGNVGLGDEPMGEGAHALIHHDGVRVPDDTLLGGPVSPPSRSSVSTASPARCELLDHSPQLTTQEAHRP
ncbi:hypothetical protein ACFYR1_19255 [Streptomyces canus]|uniref:hypothetical protein n=1 Tax=Streptomyces canus TaxID=58343 RepID=UPI00369D3C6F